MKFTAESKLLLGILGFTVLIIAVAAVVMTKPAPELTKTDLIPASAHTKGNPQAKTVLVEFSDFQCPACLAAKPMVDAVVKKYANDLLFSYRHFPLMSHPFGEKAAIAAEAAAKQGKFWEMYDMLFDNQKDFSDALFPKLAADLKLDTDKFATDSANSETRNIVLTDAADAARFGVNATPTFFLNGKKLDLRSFDDLEREVADAINKAK